MKKIILILFSVLSVFLYYFFNDSYRISLEAKAYYAMENYKKAYSLAEKAYKLNRYNTMAFTILTQSKIAKVWKNFIKESDEYFVQINSISNKDIITLSDKIRIKMMLQIIIGQYKNLPHSKLLNKNLELEAETRYKKAKELYNGIFKRTT